MEAGAPDRRSLILNNCLLMIIIALIACSFYFLRSGDPDLWWHVKSGEIIFASKDVPRDDPFSFTARDQPWIDHEWGTHALFYFLYQLYGDAGLTMLKTTIGIMTAGALFFLTRVTHRGTHLLIWAFASNLVAFYALTRPQIISYLLVSLQVFVLDHKKIITAGIWQGALLPFVFLLWANLHGGFIAGLALLGAHTGLHFLFKVFPKNARPEERRIGICLILIFVASTLATCLTPYGLDLWQLIWREFDVNALNRQYIPEWAPLWLSFGLDGQYFLVMSILVVLGFIVRPNEWKPEETLVILALFGLSIYSVRNVPFFAIVSARPVARSLGSYLSMSWHRVVARLFFIVAFAVALLPAVLKAYFIALNPSPKILADSPVTGRLPAGAVSFLITHHAAGNLFNPLGWGGYLLWHLPPQIKISIDGRSSMVYPKEVLLEHYRFYTNQDAGVVPLKRGADFLMVRAGSSVDKRVSSHSQWTVVYRDDTAVVLAANTPAGRKLIEQKRHRRVTIPDQPSPHWFP